VLGTYLFRIYSYLQYTLHAQNAHGVHSPFVYALIRDVLPHHSSNVGEQLEALRSAWAESDEVVTLQDLGAGYGADGLGMRTLPLREVIKSSARGRRSGELLHRLCAHQQPAAALELGTNLGFSAAYQASALSAGSTFTTVEGSKGILPYAQQVLALAQPACTTNLVHSSFDSYLNTLPANSLDYVLLDGNHTYEATLRYVRLLLPTLRHGALLVLDDINWNAQMRRAWREVQALLEVTVSIDLFHMGLCYMRRPQAKQQFVLWA